MERSEAIEIVRKNWPDGRHQLSEALETLIPELKESEDERIRKELCEIVNDWCNERHSFIIDKEYAQKILAWLERLGDKAFSVERVFAEAGIKPAYKDGNSWCVLIGKNIQEGICGFGETPRHAYVNFLKELWGKAFEQNPADKDELFDHRYAQHLVESQRQKSMIQWKGDNLKEVIDFTGKDRNFDKWFRSFEEYEQYVQKHNGIFKLFNADGSHYEVPVGAWIVKTPDGCNVASKAIFKQNHAWSEEDEKMLNHITSDIESIKEQVYCKTLCDEEIDWLKSLKERYTWKPSDEQMSQLECVATQNKDNMLGKELMTLFNDLKKLTE